MTARCDKCGVGLRITGRPADGRVRCPRCHTRLRLTTNKKPSGQASADDEVGIYSLQGNAPEIASVGPVEQASAAGANQRRQSLREVLAGFDGTIPKVRIGLAYRLATVLVTLAMVLLPAVYLALIGLVGYWVYRHASSAPAIFENFGHGRLAFLYYIAPLVAGVIAIFFMLKPLFAPRRRPPTERTLDVESQALLYGFVDHIAQAVRAPTPRRINVRCSANAFAAFGSGLRSFFGRDLVLTIGMPLAAEFSAQQLAGVIAHELGHFSQGAGMRMTYVVRRMNAWFERVTYERDSWDEWLREWMDDPDHYGVVFIAWLAGLCVLLSRCILWLLMTSGNLLSCLLLRQMEYHADMHQIRLAGSESSQTTLRRLPLLSWAEGEAYQYAAHCWLDGRRLPDNIPAIITHLLSSAPPDLTRAVRRLARRHKASLFSTHPSLQDRIARAEAEQAKGVYCCDLPATVLFRDFQKLCRQTTLDFYRAAFAPRIKRTDLAPTVLDKI